MLTYCTNIHPGESWPEVFRQLRRHVPTVKRAVSPDAPFPVGLRLGNRAALDLGPSERAAFFDWLDQADCFIPTLNGFPYGPFHGQAVKERVYQPDWLHRERVEYTQRLADLLADWLPQGVAGSISTVPLGLVLDHDARTLASMQDSLREILEYLAAIHARRGKKIVLALEPEPGCLLETVDGVLQWWDGFELPCELRDHLGLCYDCCHMAVEFEDAASSLRRLGEAGIPVAKVQVSSALRVPGASASALEVLCEPTYLHQVVVRREDGSLQRYLDLPDALAREPHAGEWRVHFHVPVCADRYGELETTREFIEELLPEVVSSALLEVETYTWDVLPPEWRTGEVSEDIIRELRWVQSALSATDRPAQRYGNLYAEPGCSALPS